MIIRLKYFYYSLNIVVILAPGPKFSSARYTWCFSSGTVIIHFWDNLYQEINLKIHSNTILLFILIVYAQFCNETERYQLKYFSILPPIENDARFSYISWKNVWFCFISIVWVHFSHKTGKFRFCKSFKHFFF